MTVWRVILRSVVYYWRTHLGVLLGAALGSLVLTGALLVGDSVKATLVHQAQLRIGKIKLAFSGGEHLFGERLGERIDPKTAPVLLLRGSLSRVDEAGRINQAQVIGVEKRFWEMSPSGQVPALSANGVAVNEPVARRLHLRVGESLILRIEKPSAFSRDAPLSGDENEIVAIRAVVDAIVSDANFGRFSLHASQVPPPNVYLPLGLLQQRLNLSGKSNFLLSSDVSAEGFSIETIKSRWTLEDAELDIRTDTSGIVDLRTDRIFLDPAVALAAPSGLKVLTYLVNELRSGDHATPYSMVSAVDPALAGFLPSKLKNDEIVITQWLADDLGASVGSSVVLKYFVMGERRELQERLREFHVVQVLPMNTPELNSSWMPDFPGLSDAKNCRDWHPGFDLDNGRIRDKDEAYWTQYHGTPKAFVALSVGQEMWRNRWGDLTSIRYPVGTDPNEIGAVTLSKLTPAQLGMRLLPVAEESIAATKAPVDFGELFGYFSFFLIVAASVLTALLFVFSLEQRSEEAGVLLALGITPKLLRGMLLGEGLCLAIAGSVLGAVGGVIYTRLVLWGLASVWRGAVGAVQFQFSAQVMTPFIGIVAGIITATFAMWLMSRRQLRQTARLLLSGNVPSRGAAISGKGRFGLILALGCFLIAVAMVMTGGQRPGMFFGAGGLLLLSGLVLVWTMFIRIDRASKQLGSLASLGIRNAARRRGRSLATVIVLATGVFMVVAVDSFRQQTDTESLGSRSGTGGFALLAESASPIYEDLNSQKGREAYALDDREMRNVAIVPMRVRDGDDASCLNLNRALEPRILGINPEELKRRNVFRFTQSSASWDDLSKDEGEIVNGVVDANTLQFALQKKLGDVLDYRDDRGQPFQVKLVAALEGSILQGSVLISEARFIERFPRIGGYRFFLMDAPENRVAAIGEHLSRALQDRGFEVIPARTRLAELYAVENTYLSIFQVLGGLGLLLGSTGLAIVVARNVLERRSEFGLLEALGFTDRQLRRLVFAEHRWLIFCGLLIGAVSAFLAVWPRLRSRESGFPFAEMSLLMGGLLAGCLFWTWLATRVALRGSHLNALRGE